MDERIEEAIQDLIYWKNAYTHSRNRYVETGGDPKYQVRMSANYLHILSSAEWLKRVYEEKTGKKVTTIGNLPEVDILNER